MKVYELKLKVFILQDIDLKESREVICELIDRSLVRTNEMLGIHNNNQFKFYNFNNLYPLEQNKVYKAGNIYNLIIRTVDEKLVNHFKKYLANEYTDSIKALTLECRVIPKRHIDRIYNITPAVAKFEGGYWKEITSLECFEKRIKENLIKKYNVLFDTKIDEDFDLFSFIRLDNKKPIPCSYKSITLLGDKMTLNISENAMAQELAYLALGTGILEMGSRGLGFCNYQWL